jgi:hypothetical protein
MGPEVFRRLLLCPKDLPASTLLMSMDLLDAGVPVSLLTVSSDK